mgnify:CR=1 FL=1
METASNQEVLAQLERLYYEVYAHDGYGDIRVEMRILRRGQKEVIIHCGKQYRFVVDYAREDPGAKVSRAGGPAPSPGRR